MCIRKNDIYIFWETREHAKSSARFRFVQLLSLDKLFRFRLVSRGVQGLQRTEQLKLSSKEFPILDGLLAGWLVYTLAFLSVLFAFLKAWGTLDLTTRSI